MKIVLLGPPAVGKGTQASNIVKKYNIPHISTGDILRDNIKNNTDLGIEAKTYMDNGLLVPDDLVVSIVKDRLKQDDCKNGYLLDGFPRTVNQAKELDDFLVELETSLDRVINIEAKEDILIKRITGRRICKTCGATYHIENNPPKVKDRCDIDNGELFQREDDNVETVKTRIEVYEKETQPLIKYYENKDLIINIDGTGSISDIFKTIVESLDKK